MQKEKEKSLVSGQERVCRLLNAGEWGKNGKNLAERNKQEAIAFAMKMQPLFMQLMKEGYTSNRKIAQKLNEMKVPPYRKGCQWHSTTVHNLRRRVKELPKQT